MSRTQDAINWIKAAPPGEIRTQEGAAQLFGISQAAISAGIRRRRKRHADPVRHERLQCAILAENMGASHVAAAILKRGRKWTA